MALTTRNSIESTQPGSLLKRMLAFGESRHRSALVVLLFVSLLALLPGFFQLPPIDRDEPRYAQSSKQMLESGDFVDIRFQDLTRYKKPVGIYWLQAGVVKAGEAVGISRARTKIWLYRIPSLLGAIGAVLLTYWTALAFVGRRAALLAGLMVASSVLLGIEARLAKTDAVLLLTAVAAMGAMARVYLRERESPGQTREFTLPAIFWGAMAIGFLVKGPLIFLFAGLPAAALAIADRNARWLLALRPVLGVLLVLAMAMPWFIAIAMQSGTKFFTEAGGGEMLGRIVSGQDARGAPPGYYFLLFWVTFWPGATLAAIAAWPLWRLREEPTVRFLLAWVIPAWVVFEIIVTKLPHYVLPVYPAVAILIALAVERKALSQARWLRAGTSSWFTFPLLVFAGCIAAVVYAGKSIGYLSWPTAAVAAIFGLFAWWFYSREEAEDSLMKGIAAALLLAIAVHGLMLPALGILSPSTAIARMMRSSPCPDPELASVGFHEPSLIFLTRTDTLLTDGRGAAAFLREGGCRMASIEGRQLRTFLQHAEQLGVRYDAVGRIEGFNLGSGRKVAISVFRARGD